MRATRESLNLFREKVRDVLALDLDEFGLAIIDDELVSTYLGFSLRSEFQEVRELSWNHVHGYEAHLRISKGEILIAPDTAFRLAGESDRLVCLDRIIRALHALSFRQLSPDGGMLFLKVHPQFLISVTKHGRVFEKILHAYSIPTHRVVIELQSADVAREAELYEALMNYRERGYKVAIDGVSLGYSSLDSLCSVTPDYVRFHRHFVQGAENNLRRRSIFEGLIKMIQDLGALPIVNGIESEALLRVALESGASLGQGALFGEPHAVRSAYQGVSNTRMSTAA